MDVQFDEKLIGVVAKRLQWILIATADPGTGDFLHHNDDFHVQHVAAH